MAALAAENEALHARAEPSPDDADWAELHGHVRALVAENKALLLRELAAGTAADKAAQELAAAERQLHRATELLAEARAEMPALRARAETAEAAARAAETRLAAAKNALDPLQRDYQALDLECVMGVTASSGVLIWRSCGLGTTTKKLPLPVARAGIARSSATARRPRGPLLRRTMMTCRQLLRRRMTRRP